MDTNTELRRGDSVEMTLQLPALRDASPLIQDIEDPPLPKWRLICLIISVCIGLFLSLLDTTIIATALYTIGLSLSSLQTVTWVALAYTLSYLSFCIIIARIADILGRRNTYILSLIIFLVFSLCCGFATDITTLIACRALQGMGGSGLYSLTFVILPEVSPQKLLGYIAGIAGGVVACAGVLGPVLGGIITHYTTWRWVFWINAPIGVPALVLFIIAWPEPHQLRPVQRRSIKELDFVGAALIIAASVLVVFALQEGGLKANVWHTPIFLAPIIIGCLCWIALVGWQMLIARHWEASIASMFPLRLLKMRVYMANVLSTLLMGFPYFMVIYALPLRLQVVNGKTPLLAGVCLLPMLGAVAIGSAIGGALNSKKNNTFPALLAASCMMVIGTSLMSTLPNTVDVPRGNYGYQVFIGLGFGLTMATVSIGANLEADLKDTTVAQGIIAQVRILGGSIGIAASTAILGVTQRRELAGIVTEEQLATLQQSAHLLTDAQMSAVRKAYSDAFNKDLRVCAIVAGVCVLVSLGTFRTHVQGVVERRKEQNMVEQKRLRELRRRGKGVEHLEV